MGQRLYGYILSDNIELEKLEQMDQIRVAASALISRGNVDAYRLGRMMLDELKRNEHGDH